jgi:hypothetical protein
MTLKSIILAIARAGFTLLRFIRDKSNSTITPNSKKYAGTKSK